MDKIYVRPKSGYHFSRRVQGLIKEKLTLRISYVSLTSIYASQLYTPSNVNWVYVWEPTPKPGITRLMHVQANTVGLANKMADCRFRCEATWEQVDGRDLHSNECVMVMVIYS